MKAGPKAAVEPSSLPFRPRSAGSARFAVFCERFIRVPKGTGALSPLRLRPWQLELVGQCARRRPAAAHGRLDDASRAGQVDAWWPRWACTTCCCGGEGAVVVVVAVDERQAGIVFSIARRMVELDDELAAACQVFKERAGDPGAGRASFIACRPSRNGLRAWTTRWRSSTRPA